MDIDLHLHSFFSDGTYSPQQLVKMCVEKGMKYICLTDHDTICGVDEFFNECKKHSIKAVSGIEFSTMDKREVHILGYNINYKDTGFLKYLYQVQQIRTERNAEIIKKLRKQKVYINYILPEYEGQVVGRMHIARELKKVGYVRSENEAFTRWLGFGKNCYVPFKRINTVEAIRIIKKYGGIAILAHPFQMKMSDDNLKKYILKLKDMGIDGVEVYYSSNSQSETELLHEFAQKHNLIETAGSDFHGEGRIAEIGEYGNTTMSQKDLKKIFREE